MSLVEVTVRHLSGRRLLPYWISATVGCFNVEGGCHASTPKRAQRKAERYARELARGAEPFHGPMRWVVSWPQRERDLREQVVA